MLSFDGSGAEFLKAFGALLDILRLSPPREGPNFFVPSMVHNNLSQAEAVPEEIEQLYQALRSIAI